MKCRNRPIGLCSWSLQTDIAGVAEAMTQIGIEHVHLGVREIIENAEILRAVETQSWTITSTMVDFPQEDYSSLERIKITGGIVPDDCWEQNRRLFIEAVKVTGALSVPYLSMHAGFIDESHQACAETFAERIKMLAEAAGEQNVTLLLETGQETAETLRHFLERLNHPAVGVNFDPANMILYGRGDPIEAVRTLGPWIRHVHIKDAIGTPTPGTWGTEALWGQGQVNPKAFLDVLDEVGFTGAMAVEREAGNDRFGDIKRTAAALMVVDI